MKKEKELYKEFYTSFREAHEDNLRRLDYQDRKRKEDISLLLKEPELAGKAQKQGRKEPGKRPGTHRKVEFVQLPEAYTCPKCSAKFRIVSPIAEQLQENVMRQRNGVYAIVTCTRCHKTGVLYPEKINGKPVTSEECREWYQKE